MVLHVPVNPSALKSLNNKFQQEDEEMNDNLSFTIVKLLIIIIIPRKKSLLMHRYTCM